ncbi:MAG: hypothetical protein RDU41_05985 [Clostridia bacterium]|nr:hypothetical protein [Clostridia bacterium]
MFGRPWKEVAAEILERRMRYQKQDEEWVAGKVAAKRAGKGK